MSFLTKTNLDLRAIKKNDPAAHSTLEILLTYSGFWAIVFYRMAHFFYRHNYKVVARIISQLSRFFTGIEIHPGAKIGTGVFIDHGSGVVIGETAILGNNITIYQGVTLGGTGREKGKRHPTIKDGVMISAGAKILGSFTVGENAKIGAGSVVLNEVPPNATVVGIPGKIVKINDVRVCDLDQTLPDPVWDEIGRLQEQINELIGEVINDK